MNQSLPFLPGYSFQGKPKERHVFPRTLVYSKGVPLSHSSLAPSTEMAMELLDAHNKVLDRETLTRLTYGPKRCLSTDIKLPRYLALDKKVLRFNGYIREETDDWTAEKYRIRPVTVLYYLQNDTMEVIEPKTNNSGLLQGTFLKRHAFPHPQGHGRQYLWKDLNVGMDLLIYGQCIRLTSCDQWTREYLTEVGLEVNESEAIPPDPHEQMKLSMQDRKEVQRPNKESDQLYKFLTNDRKVLRFYGIWQDILTDPPDMRPVILQYYLVDESMELLEEHTPNSGRLPLKVLVKKQKIPIDMNELPKNFPLSYLEVKDEVTFLKPKDLRTGKDLVVYGKKIFLHDCDDFTRHYYKVHFGIEDMEAIRVAEKPKPYTHRVFPPHNGIGGWEDTLQNCLSLLPKPPRKDFAKELYFDGVTLRYKAQLVTPNKDEVCRKFVLTFYPSDDSIAINEEAVPNSGFLSGAFWKRNRLQKPDISTQPLFYRAADLQVGAEVKAAGKLFKLTDADHFVWTFMEQHPQLYSDEQLQRVRQRSLNSSQPAEAKDLEVVQSDLIGRIREKVVEKCGITPYPLPHCLKPAFDLQHRDKVKEEFFCAELPIHNTLLTEVLDLCTDSNDRTDMNEVRKILLPALGHDVTQ